MYFFVFEEMYEMYNSYWQNTTRDPRQFDFSQFVWEFKPLFMPILWGEVGLQDSSLCLLKCMRDIDQ